MDRLKIKGFFSYLLIITVLLGLVQLRNAFATDQEPVQVALLSATTGTGLQESLLIGVHFKMDAGWKIYAPTTQSGKSLGYPPKFEWKASKNVESIAITWPPAVEFKDLEETSQGYKNEVIIPLTVNLKDPREPLVLSLDVDFLACSHICVPMNKKLSLSLPNTEALPTADASKILSYTLLAPHGLHIPVYSYGVILFIAFLGGFILNFMPCVLPVLSLKLRGLVKQKNAQHRSPYKVNFMATFFGILSSFLFFAFISIGLKASGQAAGWGFHFQEPSFLIFMALLVMLFACNLWGFFEIKLPQPWQQGINDILGHRSKHLSNFTEGYFSGIFATLLATPCTAPFVGTALGYALSRGPFEILTLFLAMGIGFGTPYWLWTLLPTQQILLPKPGRWMVILNQTLGFALFLTALWLVWIMAQSKGMLAGSFLLGLLVALTGVFYWGHSKPRIQKYALILIALALSIPWVFPDVNKATNQKETLVWEPFEEQKIPLLVQQGKVVFLDVTASWCLTCQVNKSLVLRSQRIESLLNSPEIVRVQADFTTKRPDIADFLARYGRFGIPFNIVFGPKAPYGIVLPELLQQEDIMLAIEKAGFSGKKE